MQEQDTGARPRSWANHDLIEWHPELAHTLPGYEQAAACGFKERARPPKPTSSRVRRSVADLRAERDELEEKRNHLNPAMSPLDHGTLSGIRRKPTAADRKQAARTDADLELFTAYTRRIDALTFRIRKEQG